MVLYLKYIIKLYTVNHKIFQVGPNYQKKKKLYIYDDMTLLNPEIVKKHYDIIHEEIRCFCFSLKSNSIFLSPFLAVASYFFLSCL